MRPILYLMLGYPGAGKTTTAELLRQLTGAVHLSSDQVRLELFPKPAFTPAEHQALYREVDRRTAELLHAGESVIYDANLNRRMHRQEKYDLCESLGVKPVLLWIQTPRPIAKQRRIKEVSSHQFIPRQESPSNTFERVADAFEEPEADEPYIAVDGTKITQAYIKELLDA